jgi:DMSO/TMAO reductase YedYZ molybdopterin-dependent catalytic subunit
MDTKKPNDPLRAGGSRRRFFTTAGKLALLGFGSVPMAKALAESENRVSSSRAVAGATSASLGTVTQPFDNGQRQLAQYPQKRPLILLTSRAVQLETPFSVYDENVITPNDAFFVRYHYQGYPLSASSDTFRVRVNGSVKNTLSLSIDDLKTQFPVEEIVAVNHCTGNSRGFVTPRVTGGQWGHGAMGNARWTGVSLRAVLDRAGVKAGAVQVAFSGMDNPKEDDIPKFVKALDIDVARNGEVMLAFAMNGEDIPLLNGYPLKLIVPGYWGTYWVKQVNNITVLNQPYDGFWMATAYREPDNDCACVAVGTAATTTRPVSHIGVRSFITNLQNNAQILSTRATEVRGIAFDSGSGIAKVQLSIDGGLSWRDVRLGPSLGRHSFRQWKTHFTARAPGEYLLSVRAIANSGATQPSAIEWNPAGYHYNVIETVRVTAV